MTEHYLIYQFGDGLPDDLELQIINDNPNDDILSIADVLPGDDYDNDGKTNLEEYTDGTDPVVPGEGSVLPGDLNGDIKITLTDSILGLQVLTDIEAGNINPKADVNGDFRIGQAEVIYSLRNIASGFGGGLFGTALDFDGTEDAVQAPALNLNTNTLTIEAWIKPDGTQTDYAGIVIEGTGNAGLYLRSGNKLGYYWNGTAWDSDWILPAGQWSHVALVITSVQARICVNGAESVNSAYHDSKTLDTVLNIGFTPNKNSFFNGRIDEVRIWSVARTLSQITADRNQPLSGSQSGLAALYNFDLTTKDVVSSNYAAVNGNPEWVISDIPE